ncbi:hypothetical protein NXC14_PA00198 (plasmid) [Rhizobium sp. NXC14]|nr:hypothetical protein NXC14_PA00198 [Rhizobium sp. NXC14]
MVPSCYGRALHGKRAISPTCAHIDHPPAPGLTSPRKSYCRRLDEIFSQPPYWDEAGSDLGG